MMARLLLTVALMLLVAFAACSEVTSPPSPEPVVGDTLLTGVETMPAIDAIVDKTPTAAPDSEIDGDFIRTRLTVVVNPSATVGQVNDALLANGARISASVAGVPFLVLSIPPAADEAAARVVANALVATGAFVLAKPERLSPIKQARVLPASGDSGISHLVPGRLPAAWNVGSAVTARARVIVGDYFHQLTPIATVTPLRFLPSSPQTPELGQNHGFHVAGILAANHGDAADFTGAFPRADRIDVDGVSMSNLSWPEMSLAIFNAFPATGSFLISTSLGYPSGPTNDGLAFEYAMDALHWRMLVWNEVSRFLHLTAASNEGDSVGIVGQAFSSSPYNLARFEADLLTYVNGLAVPGADRAAFAVLWNYAAAHAPVALQASPNLLSVGSSSRAGVESTFSSRGSDVRTVGERVYGPCVVADTSLARFPTTDCNGTRARYSGTSMATPLVAGIAAYLWSLEPSLTPVMLRDILQEAYNSAWVGGVLDAYFAVQLLDQSLADAVIRRALLDVATPASDMGTDGRFDESDVQKFRLEFEDWALVRDAFADPSMTDHSRYDLNGDGITGDTTRFAPFDLNADGVLSVASLTIEGEVRDFDEVYMSDLGILCYYVYSDLYDGDPEARQQVAPECSPACPEVPQGVSSARSSHQSQCPGPILVVESVSSRQDAQCDVFARSAAWPGGVEVRDQRPLAAPPMSCEAVSGSASAEIRMNSSLQAPELVAGDSLPADALTFSGSTEFAASVSATAPATAMVLNGNRVSNRSEVSLRVGSVPLRLHASAQTSGVVDQALWPSAVFAATVIFQVFDDAGGIVHDREAGWILGGDPNRPEAFTDDFVLEAGWRVRILSIAHAQAVLSSDTTLNTGPSSVDAASAYVLALRFEPIEPIDPM